MWISNYGYKETCPHLRWTIVLSLSSNLWLPVKSPWTRFLNYHTTIGPNATYGPLSFTLSLVYDHSTKNEGTHWFFSFIALVFCALHVSTALYFVRYIHGYIKSYPENLSKFLCVHQWTCKINFLQHKREIGNTFTEAHFQKQTHSNSKVKICTKYGGTSFTYGIFTPNPKDFWCFFCLNLYILWWCSGK